jgi:hypothetical protein
MKLQHARAIENAANDGGLDVRVHEKYSGRGMYGKETAAVSGSFGDLVSCIAQVARDFARDDEAEEFVVAMRDLARDNMGYDMVVY